MLTLAKCKMRASRWSAAALLMLLLAPLAALHAADKEPPSSADLAFFEREVRPLLAEKCFQCHGPKKQSSGLRLDHISSILAGGESGPALVPGEPSKSLLVEAINYESFEMPPKQKLRPGEIATLTRWVKLGAPWPEGEKAPPAAHVPGKITAADRQWWCFQPLRTPAVPSCAETDGCQNEIDRFLLEKLRAAGFAFAPPADRATLIRRVTFDLTGLPPRPEDVAAFVADDSPEAYPRLVERLLASPQYGETWARHWLDLVRYADSDGYKIDEYRPNSWRYRDYVVRSFNADKPYARFVEEQLAGDELFPGDPDALTATGYLRHGIYEYNNRDVKQQWQSFLDDITDTTSDVFLGLGLACARCHDHKFDPLLQKDYYRLQAFFAALDPRDDLTATTPAEDQAYREKLTAWEQKTADIRSQMETILAKHRAAAEKDAIIKFPDDIQAMLHKPAAERTPYEHQLADLAFRQVLYEWDHLDAKLKGDEKEKVIALRKQLAEFDNEKPAAPPLVLAAVDLGPTAPPVVAPKIGPEPIAPGFPTLLQESPAEIAPLPALSNTTGRRAALARWLTRPENPLTARVMVNRVWQEHFGRGLVANPSDFGRLTEPPLHVELLDWLATRFIAEGWSLKKLHTVIVLSAAYRQSATPVRAAELQKVDPENKLYGRAPVRRLEAEQIRDAVYAATGELNLKAAGGPGAAEEAPRRSLYLRVMRNTRNPLLESFDAPLSISSTATRYTTTTPVQSLLLLNGQFLRERAAALARRLEQEAGAKAEARLERAYQLLYGRAPNTAEMAAAKSFLAAQAERINAEQASSPEAAFRHEKLPFRDGQAAVIDEKQPPLLAAEQLSVPGDFTIEAYFLLHSIYDSGSVRVLAAQWNGDEKSPGWMFGVTGKKSRRKPQTLVLQLTGHNKAGELVSVPIFSDQHVPLEKPCYAAASVRFAGEGPGNITFFIKDLSNDDEQLQQAVVPHDFVGGVSGPSPLSLGGRSGKSDSRFDGLVDDVRFSNAALDVKQILYTGEGVNSHTMGFWKFEPKPDVFADSSGKNVNLKAPAKGKTAVDRQRQAWIDLCHVLLNSSEFLYVP